MRGLSIFFESGPIRTQMYLRTGRACKKSKQTTVERRKKLSRGNLDFEQARMQGFKKNLTKIGEKEKKITKN